MNKKQKSLTNKGFSLVELIIVIYRNGYCTEYSTAGKEKLRIIEEKKGYRI